MNKVFKVLLILLASVFPYFHRITSLLIVLLILVWIVKGGYRNVTLIVKNKYAILYLSLFIISLISLIYSSNKELGFLEKRLPLIIFPVILFNSQLNKKDIQGIFYSFALGCIITSLYSLINAINQPSLLGIDMTVKALGISHVYFGLYLSFTIIGLIYFLLIREKHDYISVCMALTILYLVFFLLLLGGKMSIIASFLLVIIISVRFVIKTKRWFLGLVFLILPIVIFFVIINSFENTRNRFYSLLDRDNYQVGDNYWNNIGSRLTILKCSNEIFKNAPIFGTGIGDIQNDLDTCNELSEFQTLKGMNTHNQYFQFLLGTGIIGVICFLGTLLNSIVISFRSRNSLYLFFLFLIMLCCLTESILERQTGAIFYAFFNSVFVFNEQSIYKKNGKSV